MRNLTLVGFKKDGSLHILAGAPTPNAAVLAAWAALKPNPQTAAKPPKGFTRAELWDTDRGRIATAI